MSIIQICYIIKISKDITEFYNDYDKYFDNNEMIG